MTTTPAQDKSIADVSAAFGGGTTPTSGMSTDTFMQTLQDKLMGMSSLVSSDSTSLESAITSSQQATTQGAQLIESQGNREIAAKATELGATRTNFLESGRGFAVNSAVLRQLDESTDKSLKDMEQRKQELILQNNIAGANKVADLQVQAETFRQNARQQAFSNILNLGQLGIQKQAQDNATSQFKETLSLNKAQLAYQEDSDISKIATQYGLTVSPGETLASITTKAKPFASAEQKARLAEMNKKSVVDNTQLNVDDILMQVITGVGDFEAIGPQGPARAALEAANYMKSVGLTPTREDIARFTASAVKLKADYDTSLEKSKAETVGNSFWGNFSSFFGGAAASSAQEGLQKSNYDFSKVLNASGNANYTPPTFFNLFNQ